MPASRVPIADASIVAAAIPASTPVAASKWPSANRWCHPLTQTVPFCTVPAIACTWCEARFVPWQYSQHFCSTKCQQAEYHHRKRDERNAKSRKWHHANADKAKRSRWRSHLRRYGITPDDFNRMVDEQDGRCAICLRIPSHRLRVDHDHASGQVRALLCLQCNLAIGYLGESVSAALNAAAYIERYGGSNG